MIDEAPAPSTRRALWAAWATRWAPILVPAAVAGALGLWGIETPSFFRDEVVTVAAVQRSVAELFRTMANLDAVFAAYYVALHEWAQLVGTSHLALRLPSLLALIGTAAVVGALGLRVHGARAGLLGGVLYALLPLATFVGQFARPHSIAVFFVALSTLLLLVAIEKRTARWWMAYAVAAAFIGWGHLISFAAVASHAIAIGVASRREHPGVWKPWLVSVVAASILVAPFAIVAIVQSSQFDWLKLTSLDVVGEKLGQLVGVPLVAGFVGALALLGAGGARDRTSSWLLGSLGTVPVALVFAAGAFVPLFHYRYVVFTLIAWAVLAGITLARVRASVAVVCIGLVVALSASTYVAQRAPGSHGDGGLDTVAAEVARGARPGDGIVYAPFGWLRHGIDYYLPAENRPRDVYLSKSSIERESFTASECSNRARCLGDTPRVWVVCIGAPADPLECLSGPAAEPLRGRYLPGPTSIHDALSVTLYTLAPVP